MTRPSRDRVRPPLAARRLKALPLDALPRLRGDLGSATVLMAGVIGAVVFVSTAIVGVSTVLVERHRLNQAADAASLAAADTAAGLRAGLPCEQAEALAAVNSSTVEACAVEGMTVTVRVRSSVGPIPVHATATAGQPPDFASLRTDGSKK